MRRAGVGFGGICLVGLACAVACGGASSHDLGAGAAAAGAAAGVGGDSGADAGEPMTQDAACRAAVEAQCEVDVRCGFRPDLSSCMDVAELCPEFYFSPGSTRNVSAIAACLDTLRNESCSELLAGVTPACLSAGTLPDDTPCSYSSQCVSGLCEASVGALCRTCQHQGGLGEACSATLCAQGNYCSSALVCAPLVPAPLAADGEPCEPSGGPFCQGTLACGPTDTSATPICHVLPGEGEPCLNNLCAWSLSCRSSSSGSAVCANPNSCETFICPSNTYCQYVGPNSSGSCAAYVPLSGACDATTSCASGLVCRNGLCVEQPKRGEPCQDYECGSLQVCAGGVCGVPASCL